MSLGHEIWKAVKAGLDIDKEGILREWKEEGMELDEAISWKIDYWGQELVEHVIEAADDWAEDLRSEHE